MGGGLMQLVAYGAQDIYLTGNPQITFFKVVYRRHTNFAMESIEQTFQGQADFGRRVSAVLSRNGDLAYRTYLQVTLPEINQSANASGDVHPCVDLPHELAEGSVASRVPVGTSCSGAVHATPHMSHHTSATHPHNAVYGQFDPMACGVLLSCSWRCGWLFVVRS